MSEKTGDWREETPDTLPSEVEVGAPLTLLYGSRNQVVPLEPGRLIYCPDDPSQEVQVISDPKNLEEAWKQAGDKRDAIPGEPVQVTINIPTDEELNKRLHDLMDKVSFNLPPEGLKAFEKAKGIQNDTGAEGFHITVPELWSKKIQKELEAHQRYVEWEKKHFPTPVPTTPWSVRCLLAAGEYLQNVCRALAGGKVRDDDEAEW